MSISEILSGRALNQTNNLQVSNQQRRTEFQQLAQNLQSGDLGAARQVFTLATNGPSGTAIADLQLSRDLRTLGEALQSGNLAGARTAYAALQQDAQHSNVSLQVPHHHHHGGEIGRRAPLTTRSSASGAPEPAVNAMSDALQLLSLAA